MPSRTFEPIGYRIPNAMVLYLIVLSFPSVIVFDMAGYDLSWPAWIGYSAVVMASIGLLVGRWLDVTPVLSVIEAIRDSKQSGAE